jgi:hypothetical protein
MFFIFVWIALIYALKIFKGQKKDAFSRATWLDG